MTLPPNTHIESIDKVIIENSMPTVRRVERCVPEVNRHVLLVHVYGNTIRLTYSKATIATDVSIRAVHEYNVASGYCTEDDVDRMQETKRCSLARTKRIAIELLASNSWDWFVTITLNPEKWNRRNPDGLQHAISEYYRSMRNIRINGTRQYKDAKYLFIPELHKNGCVHLHGVVFNYPGNRLQQYELDPAVPLPEYIINSIKNGIDVEHSLDFDRIFGYNTFTRIIDIDRAASYISQYITKTASEVPFKTLLWHSRGLQTAHKVRAYIVPAEMVKDGSLYSAMESLASVNGSGKSLFRENKIELEPGTFFPVGATCLINQSDIPIEKVIQFLNNLLGEDGAQ